MLRIVSLLEHNWFLLFSVFHKKFKVFDLETYVEYCFDK